MRPAEGRHELRAVLSGQTTGRAGAQVNEPPGPTQSALFRKSSSLDRGRGQGSARRRRPRRRHAGAERARTWLKRLGIGQWYTLGQTYYRSTRPRASYAAMRLRHARYAWSLRGRRVVDPEAISGIVHTLRSGGRWIDVPPEWPPGKAAVANISGSPGSADSARRLSRKSRKSHHAESARK